MRLRLSLFYAAFFALIGVQQPFWPLWLASKGLGVAEIGIALAVGIGIKALSAPLAAHFADRSGDGRRLIRVLATTSLGAFCLFALADGFWPIVVVSVLFYGLWPPVMSLTESITVRAARQGVLNYGRVRLWGSVSFIVVALASGQTLVVLPAQAVFWVSLALLAFAVVACRRLPDAPVAASHSRRLPIVEVLRNRSFVAVIAACALIQGSHAVYYAFATLHWRAAGYSEAVIGALWAEGVIAEIILFAFDRPLLARLGAGGLIVLAGACGGVRWLGTGLSAELPALVALQALHAFSFGAAHIGAMAFIAGRVAPGVTATAQSLYSGLVWGVGLGSMLLAAGWLYRDLGGSAFQAMAVVALAGVLVAAPVAVSARRFPRTRSPSGQEAAAEHDQEAGDGGVADHRR